jgi:hypothetical protein
MGLIPIVGPIFRMPGSSWLGPRPELDTYQHACAQYLEDVARMLTENIGERNFCSPEGLRGLEAARDKIANAFRAFGFDTLLHPFEASGHEMHNVVAEKRGVLQPERIYVFGAHYDSRKGTIGADDNASGVAILLALAKLFAGLELECTLRFVAFANEETLPGVPWENMGSYAYAAACHDRGEQIAGMINFDNVGVYFDEPGSQGFPKPFSWLYPDTGNFIAFIGDQRFGAFIRQCIGIFRSQNLMPSEGAAIPMRWATGQNSDHWSFGRFGWPSVMVTNTGPLRDRRNHTMMDVADNLDYQRMTLLLFGMRAVLNDLVGVWGVRDDTLLSKRLDGVA